MHNIPFADALPDEVFVLIEYDPSKEVIEETVIRFTDVLSVAAFGSEYVRLTGAAVAVRYAIHKSPESYALKLVAEIPSSTVSSQLLKEAVQLALDPLELEGR